MTKAARGEPFDGDTLLADGWVRLYMEPNNWLPAAAWEAFLSIIGFSNYRVLGFTTRMDSEGGVWKRSQFLMISPRGMQNLMAHSKKPPSV